MEINFINIPTVFILATLVIGFLRYKSLSKYELLILVIPSLNFIADVVSSVLINRHISTNFCYNLLIPIEISLTLFIYSKHLIKKKSRILVFVTMLIFLLFSIINLLFIQEFISEFASYNFFLGGILVCMFSYLVWREEILDGIISPKKVILWFAAANFIYYTISVPVMSANNWLVLYLKEMAIPIYLINSINYAIWSVFLSLGLLWKNRKAI